MTATSRPFGYQPITVADGLRASAGRTPGKVALSEGGRELTYAALVDRMHRVGNATAAGLGLTPGSHVGILAPNCLEYVELVAGLAAAGIAAVTISPRSAPAEARAVADDAEIAALFVHPSAAALAEEGGVGEGVPRVELGDPYERLLADARPSRPQVAIEEWDTMVVHYTSGTTGQPKGVLVPHRSRVLNYFGMAAEYGCYGPDDRALAIAPLYHGAGLSFALAPLFFGGHTTILPRFDPEAVLDALDAASATNVFMVPTHFHALFALGEARVRACRHEALKTIISNAAPLSQSSKEQIVTTFGDDLLFECYGSTEAGIVSNLRPADQLRKKRSVGLPFPNTEVELLGDDGEPVSAGQVGELYSRSPALFGGYWRRPEATAECMRDDWFSAGDLAWRDDEGYLYLVDRKGDRIVTGGLNVYPREVEEVLGSAPGVAESAVFGAPDDRWGEVVRAALVIEPGADLDEAAVMAHCRARLAGHKVPRHLDLCAELPRNPAGKVLRRALRDPHWAGRDRAIS